MPPPRIGTSWAAAPAFAQARMEVLSPRAGSTVHGAVRVQVRVDRGTVTARLNGRRSERPLIRIAGGSRAVLLGAAQGLRHGKNEVVLHYSRRGRPAARRTMHFTVSKSRPLAGIRVRGQAVAGAPIRLEGLPRSRPGHSGKVRHRWSLVRSPRGSRLRPARTR